MKKTVALNLLAFVLSCGTISAATFTVTDNTNTGPGTLRDEIAAANAGDTIIFDPTMTGTTITLTSGAITIDKDLTIRGPGYAQLTIDGNNNGRIFFINNASVSMHGMKMVNGYQNESLENNGGAIYHINGGNLTLNNLWFDNDRAINGNGSQGGAVAYFIPSGIFKADTCFFMNCSSDNYGGALSLNAYPTLSEINACTFDGNYSAEKGMIFSNTMTLNISNSTFSNNTAVRNSILWASGGDPGAACTFTNCTFSHNTGSSPMGGILCMTHLTMINCTYTANNEPIYVFGGMMSQPVFTVQNNIFNAIGNNLAGSPYQVVSNGGNICSDASMTSYLTESNDMNNTDPMLDAVLANNGGVTLTHALLENSLAVGNGSMSGAPTYDQTGALRLGNPDCGAVESSLATSITSNASKNSGVLVYSNPTDGMIRFSGIDKNSNLGIYDACGKRVLEILTTGEIQSIDVSSLNSGVYLFKISGNKPASGTFIKN